MQGIKEDKHNPIYLPILLTFRVYGYHIMLVFYFSPSRTKTRNISGIIMFYSAKKIVKS